MNPKIIATLTYATITGIAVYSAYRIGEEVGKQRKEFELLETFKQRELAILQEEESAEEPDRHESTLAEEEDMLEELVTEEEPAEDPEDEEVIIDHVRGAVYPNSLKYHEEDMEAAMNENWDRIWGEQQKTLVQRYHEKFLEHHPYEASKSKTKTKEELTMEADQAYITNAVRYINSEATIALLVELDEYYVEEGPAVDQITFENSLDKRNTIRQAHGLDPVSIPTWFDLYIYFLRDFEDDPNELNEKLEDLMAVWRDYTYNYGQIGIEDVLHAFSMNMVPAGSHYSPFGLSQSQVNYLEENYRNNLTGQKNEWIRVESPLI